ncbi:MAG: VOC family protein [Bacteroidota bacterium]|nr:VOC family protein [Bacteroidota bacterium]MDP4254040.1 VOC family protein [Bacteroidota bacterium]MDP4257430.1 VOC family protein [Bacteroidota bacterium]
MRLTFLRPMLRTDNIKATIDFYTGTLGFILEEYNEGWGWASLHKDDVWIMLARPDEHEEFKGPAFTGSLYFTTDDVDRVWHQVKDKAKVCYEPESFEWGMKEFAIYDNNGYLLQFGQPTTAD